MMANNSIGNSIILFIYIRIKTAKAILDLVGLKNEYLSIIKTEN